MSAPPKRQPGRSLRHSQSVLRLLFDSNPFPMWIFDRKTLDFLEVNDAALKKYGYTRAEFMAMKLTQIRPEGDVPRLLKFLGEMEEGVQNQGEWRHVAKSGHLLDMEIITHVVHWGGREAVLTVAHDLTERNRMQETLSGTEERLKAVIQNAPIVLFALDPAGIVTLAEGKSLRNLGRKTAEMVGQSIFDLFKDNAPAIEAARKALRGENVTADIRWDQRTFETQFSAQFDAAGKVRRIAGVAIDVTEARQAQQLMLQQSAAVRASMDGMSILSLNGEYIYLNEAYAKLYGYDRPEDLLGKTWRGLYRQVELDRFDSEIMPALARDGHWRGESSGKRKDGRLFPQEICLIAIEGGGLVCVVRDITDRKMIEEQKSRLLELEKMARFKAESASRAKDEFLALVSHELRTPMAAMMGWMWLLRYGGADEPTRERAFDIIERNMKLQAQISEDLLDISSIVTGKLKLETSEFEILPILKSVLDVVRPAAEARSIGIHVEFDPKGGSILGDPDRLQQIFWNLMSNAIKFTPEGGTVNLAMHQHHGQIEVSVSDSGQGISEDFLPAIFNPFYQEESTLTRRHRGLGLGLAIVKHLVELHGGTISAASPGPGKGATFTVKIPAATSASGKPAKVALSKRKESDLQSVNGMLTGVNILIVDDAADNCTMIGAILEKAGAKVTAVASAPEAFKAFRAKTPDVLVSDIMMPEEDGYSLIRKIRALGPERGGNVPAVALTACARIEDRTLALLAGFHIYVTKPVEPVELTTVIASLINNPASAAKPAPPVAKR